MEKRPRTRRSPEPTTATDAARPRYDPDTIPGLTAASPIRKRVPQMAAKKLKASERSTFVGKLATTLKKRYGSSVPAPAVERDVLQTLLYAALLEEGTDEPAELAYTRLTESFHDLNEVRVSSIREIERVLQPLPASDWRSLRIKDALQHIFELNYNYDLESLRKKNQDQASGELGEIPRTTPYMKLYVLQVGLGNHAVPVDHHQLALLRWLGLTEPDATEEQAAADLKSAVRKSDGPLVAYLLRSVANEPGVLAVTLPAMTEEPDAEAASIDPKTRMKELDELLDGKAPKKAAKKTAPAAKKTAKKATKKAAKKAVRKKAAT